jgi:DNA-binding transcriptional regulator YiaG
MKLLAPSDENPPFAGLERVKTNMQVSIPAPEGAGRAPRVLEVEVNGWRDPADGEIYLNGNTTAFLDQIKAHKMGLLAPEDFKRIRESLRLTQEEISRLLQIGQRSWTRWETGRERPTRSINLLVRSLYDGIITVPYLEGLQKPIDHEPLMKWRCAVCPGLYAVPKKPNTRMAKEMDGANVSAA